MSVSVYIAKESSIRTLGIKGFPEDYKSFWVNFVLDLTNRNVMATRGDINNELQKYNTALKGSSSADFHLKFNTNEDAVTFMLKWA